ncbi:hypothetical protein CCFV1_ORF044 [Cotesia congregata filamentous virus 1]|uniref:Uncharacterized protein n=1 Tax=Cotesia congregata filamentous virus 1 TaxID=3064291 RepID=A0ABC8QS29_9VIRU|nr:hypothetical protein CCFV1_ORF044 [Cotesia congregata filamentous virus 1]
MADFVNNIQIFKDTILRLIRTENDCDDDGVVDQTTFSDCEWLKRLHNWLYTECISMEERQNVLNELLASLPQEEVRRGFYLEIIIIITFFLIFFCFSLNSTPRRVKTCGQRFLIKKKI